MTARDRVARDWHAKTFHASIGVPLYGDVCNCGAEADRIIPMLRDAWAGGYGAGHSDANPWGATYPSTTPNPYETEEDKMGEKCSFCEEATDDLTTGGSVAACRDCMAEGDRHVDQ